MRPFNTLINQCIASLGLAAITLSTVALAGETEEVGALLQSGRYQQALDRIDALPHDSRAQPQIRLYHGMSLMALDRRSEALRSFETLAAEYPNMPEPFNNMAVIHAAHGRYGEARVLLEKALRADARYSVAQENIGDVYIRLASQTYARLRILDPQRKPAHARHEAVQSIGKLIDLPEAAR